jgi:hypothetical protein
MLRQAFCLISPPAIYPSQLAEIHETTIFADNSLSSDSEVKRPAIGADMAIIALRPALAVAVAHAAGIGSIGAGCNQTATERWHPRPGTARIGLGKTVASRTSALATGRSPINIPLVGL